MAATIKTGGLVFLLTFLAIPALSPVAAQDSQITTRRLWKGYTGNLCCQTTYRPSPDGRYVSGVNWLKTGDLAYLDLFSGEWVDVTSHDDLPDRDDFSMGGAFSPDGKQMVQAWYVRNDSAFDFRTENLDTGETRILIPTDRNHFIWPMDWSPDGDHILAQRSRDEEGTAVMDLLMVPADGGDFRVVRVNGPLGGEGGESVEFARFSPDSRWIAFSVRSGGTGLGDIRIMAADGSQESGLVMGNGDDNLLAWLPDGSGILFRSDRNLTDAVWKLPVRDGKPAGEPELVKSGMWSIQPLGFAPMGLYYVVTTDNHKVFTQSLDLARGELTSDANPIQDGGRVVVTRMPVWSPDGRQLAYQEGADEPGVQRKLMIHSMETGETRAIPFPWAPDGWTWTGDGQGMVFVATHEGVSGFHRLDLQTQEVELLLSFDELRQMGGVPYPPSGAAISMDGRELIFPKLEGSNQGLWALDLETREENHLSDLENVERALGLPNGGGYVIARVDRSGAETHLQLTHLDKEGAEVETIWEGDQPLMPRFNLLATADGRYVLLHGGKDETHRVLLSFDTRTHARSVLYDREVAEGADGRYLSLRPDGTMLAFSRGSAWGEIWVMEGIH